MTAAGALNGNALSLSFTHAMSLIEIAIDETSNSSASYDPAPIFYGINKPWKMSDGIYRSLVSPGKSIEVGLDYGPADNRLHFRNLLRLLISRQGNIHALKLLLIIDTLN